jgi:hypothetical protein
MSCDRLLLEWIWRAGWNSHGSSKPSVVSLRALVHAWTSPSPVTRERGANSNPERLAENLSISSQLAMHARCFTGRQIGALVKRDQRHAMPIVHEMGDGAIHHHFEQRIGAGIWKGQ